MQHSSLRSFTLVINICESAIAFFEALKTKRCPTGGGGGEFRAQSAKGNGLKAFIEAAYFNWAF